MDLTVVVADNHSSGSPDIEAVLASRWTAFFEAFPLPPDRMAFDEVHKQLPIRGEKAVKPLEHSAGAFEKLSTPSVTEYFSRQRVEARREPLWVHISLKNVRRSFLTFSARSRRRSQRFYCRKRLLQIQIERGRGFLPSSGRPRLHSALQPLGFQFSRWA